MQDERFEVKYGIDVEGGRKMIREEARAECQPYGIQIEDPPQSAQQNLHQNTGLIGSTCRDREGDEENEGGSRSMAFFRFFGEVPRGGQKKNLLVSFG